MHSLMNENDVTLIIYHPMKNTLTKLSSFHYHWQQTHMDIIETPGMRYNGAMECLFVHEIRSHRELSERTAFNNVLVRYGFALPLSYKLSAALLTIHQYSKRDIKFICSYIGGFPQVQKCWMLNENFCLACLTRHTFRLLWKIRNCSSSATTNSK